MVLHPPMSVPMVLHPPMFLWHCTNILWSAVGIHLAMISRMRARHSANLVSVAKLL